MMSFKKEKTFDFCYSPYHSNMYSTLTPRNESSTSTVSSLRIHVNMANKVRSNGCDISESEDIKSIYSNYATHYNSGNTSTKNLKELYLLKSPKDEKRIKIIRKDRSKNKNNERSVTLENKRITSSIFKEDSLNFTNQRKNQSQIKTNKDTSNKSIIQKTMEEEDANTTQIIFERINQQPQISESHIIELIPMNNSVENEEIKKNKIKQNFKSERMSPKRPQCKKNLLNKLCRQNQMNKNHLCEMEKKITHYKIQEEILKSKMAFIQNRQKKEEEGKTYKNKMKEFLENANKIKAIEENKLKKKVLTSRQNSKIKKEQIQKEKEEKRRNASNLKKASKSLIKVVMNEYNEFKHNKNLFKVVAVKSEREQYKTNKLEIKLKKKNYINHSIDSKILDEIKNYKEYEREIKELKQIEEKKVKYLNDTKSLLKNNSLNLEEKLKQRKKVTTNNKSLFSLKKVSKKKS